jgi:hypothetical protein
MLPAPNFAIIGKDSLVTTSIQNGIDKEEAKELIAKEYGYAKVQLCFVEQPDYHIDLMIMLLGDKKVMVKQKNKDIELTQTINDLKEFGLEVTSDSGEVAGKQTQDGKWEYNFFNGEYVIGKDGKLYYVTNGTVDEKAEEKFRTFLKAKVANLEDVIFSKKLILNYYMNRMVDLDVGPKEQNRPDQVMIIISKREVIIPDNTLSFEIFHSAPTLT